MSMFVNRHARAACIAILTVLMTATGVRGVEADASTDSLVESLISLRGEVDRLETQVRELSREREGQLSTLLRQEAELSAERQRQELRLEKLKQQLAQRRKTVARPDIDDEKLRTVVSGAIDEARAYVASSLPFTQVDRIAALDQLEAQLRSGALEPTRVANQLWAFLADEIQLAGEVGLFRQPIDIEGDARLVDIARVGMMNLYFRTDDDRVGYWAPGLSSGEYRYARGADQDHIRALMAALRTNVRSGYFILPTASQTEAH